MVFRETFLQIHKRLIRQLIQECSITWIDFSFAGSIPVQVSMERPVMENGDRDNNRSWAKWLNSQIVFQFSVLFFVLTHEETIDWNSNAFPEGVYLKN